MLPLCKDVLRVGSSCTVTEECCVVSSFSNMLEKVSQHQKRNTHEKSTSPTESSVGRLKYCLIVMSRLWLKASVSWCIAGCTCMARLLPYVHWF